MAIRFPGTSGQALQATLFPNISMTSLTICQWVQLKTGSNSCYLNYFGSGTNSIDLEIDATTVTEIDIGGTGVLLSIATLQPGAWHFVGYTVGGSTPFTLTAFTSPPNGGPLAVQTTTNTFSGVTTSNQLLLGDFTTAGAAPLIGAMANVMVWYGALPIQTLQNQQYSLTPITTQGLGGFWPLLNVQDALTDYSGNNAKLTKVGAVTLTTDTGPPIAWE